MQYEVSYYNKQTVSNKSDYYSAFPRNPSEGKAQNVMSALLCESLAL